MAVFVIFAIFATITFDLVIIVCTMVLLWYYVGCCRSVIIKQSMNNKFMDFELKGNNMTSTKTARTGRLSVRVNPEIRDSASQVLEHYGLDMSSAVNLFLYQIVNTQRFPFSLESSPYEHAIDEAMKEKPIAAGTVDDFAELMRNA